MEAGGAGRPWFVGSLLCGGVISDPGERKSRELNCTHGGYREGVGYSYSTLCTGKGSPFGAKISILEGPPYETGVRRLWDYWPTSNPLLISPRRVTHSREEGGRKKKHNRGMVWVTLTWKPNKTTAWNRREGREPDRNLGGTALAFLTASQLHGYDRDRQQSVFLILLNY